MPRPPKDLATSSGKARGLANLRKGNPGNKSKATYRAFKELCRDSLDRVGALKVVEHIIAGDISEEIGRGKLGEIIYGETKNADRLKAVQFLAGYAHGMPTQKVEDVTQRAAVAPVDVVALIPALLGVLQVPQQDRARLLQSVSIDAEVVG